MNTRLPKIRAVLISDTHEQHRHARVPEGDLLIHAGDFTMFNRSIPAILDFNDWLTELPHRYKVLIPGNHDCMFRYQKWRDLITGASLLINEGIEIAGLRLWGSVIVPSNKRIYSDGTRNDRIKVFARIPDDTDILITHVPPQGILDIATLAGEPQGYYELLAAVRRVRPRLHVFGHIHLGYGIRNSQGTCFINAALAGPGAALTNPPATFDAAPRVAVQQNG